MPFLRPLRAPPTRPVRVHAPPQDGRRIHFHQHPLNATCLSACLQLRSITFMPRSTCTSPSLLHKFGVRHNSSMMTKCYSHLAHPPPFSPSPPFPALPPELCGVRLCAHDDDDRRVPAHHRRVADVPHQERRVQRLCGRLLRARALYGGTGEGEATRSPSPALESSYRRPWPQSGLRGAAL